MSVGWGILSSGIMGRKEKDILTPFSTWDRIISFLTGTWVQVGLGVATKPRLGIRRWALTLASLQWCDFWQIKIPKS